MSVGSHCTLKAKVGGWIAKVSDLIPGEKQNEGLIRLKVGSK